MFIVLFSDPLASTSHASRLASARARSLSPSRATPSQIYGQPRAERCADFAVPHRNVDAEVGVDGIDGSADVVTRLYNDAVYLRGKWVKKDAATGEVIVGASSSGQRIVVAQEAKGKLDKRRQELHSEKLTRSKPDVSVTRRYYEQLVERDDRYSKWVVDGVEREHNDQDQYVGFKFALFCFVLFCFVSSGRVVRCSGRACSPRPPFRPPSPSARASLPRSCTCPQV